jgi:hypothetical protein
MSNEEMVGRMAGLKVIAMTASGLHLANIRNDPDHERSGVLLATMRDALRTRSNAAHGSPKTYDLRRRPPPGRSSPNLSQLRGEASQLTLALRLQPLSHGVARKLGVAPKRTPIFTMSDGVAWTCACSSS